VDWRDAYSEFDRPADWSTEGSSIRVDTREVRVEGEGVDSRDFNLERRPF